MMGEDMAPTMYSVTSQTQQTHSKLIERTV